MAERWRYAADKHPPYCTCVSCKGDVPRTPHSQPSNQLRPILEKWQSKNFDPHYVLGISPNSSRKLIVQAHRRWVLTYHPDKHQDDPVATELTKRLNAARDELLGKGRRQSQSQRDQQRRQEEAQERARETERQRRRQARQRAREAESRRQNEERRQQREEAARTARQYAENRKHQRDQRQQEDFHWSEWIDQQNRQGWRTRSKRGQTRGGKNSRRNAANTGNSMSLTIVALALATLIAVYLILTITAPDTIDNLMEEWARLFN